jgi:hypothetical protein
MQAKHASENPIRIPPSFFPEEDAVRVFSPWNAMKYRRVDHGPAVSLAAIAILIVVSAAALKYLGS